MPILYNDKPLLRIKFKDADIREVRRGNELEWGLYKITYISKLPEQYEPSENITEYVWGCPSYDEESGGSGYDEDFKLIIPEGDDEEYGGFTADTANIIFGSYQRTGAVSWCTDKECLNYIPAITKDFHKDLLLFCKWKQRQYWYSGHIKNERDKWVEGSGGGSGFEPRTSTPRPYESGSYPWAGSSDLSMPNCTWYAYYRVQEAGSTAPLAGRIINACNWFYAELGEGWDKLSPGEYSSYEPGDIVCYDESESGDGGHVAVVEDGSHVSASWWRNLTGQRATYSTAGELASWILDGPGSSYSYAYWHNDRSPQSEYSGRIQGILRYKFWDNPGGGHWEPDPPGGEDFEYSMALCAYPDSNLQNSGNQNFPRSFHRFNQATEDEDYAHPHDGVHWRHNQRWEPLNTYTYERTGQYVLQEDGTYKLVFSDWSSEPVYSATLNGNSYLEWDTSDPTKGQLEGWKFDDWR